MNGWHKVGVQVLHQLSTIQEQHHVATHSLGAMLSTILLGLIVFVYQGFIQDFMLGVGTFSEKQTSL